MFLLRANLKWCKVLLFYKSAEWTSPYGTSRHKVCSPQKSVLFLSDIFFMSSCPSSEVWSKILFACVVRQAEGTHCRAGIHSPQQGWELCTTRLDKQLLFSYCPPPGCKDPAKISSPSQPWMEQCFLVRGWRRFHPCWPFYQRVLQNCWGTNPAGRTQLPHCCWLYDLKLQPESGWGAVGFPVLFQSSPRLISSPAFPHSLEMSRAIR